MTTWSCFALSLSATLVWPEEAALPSCPSTCPYSPPTAGLLTHGLSDWQKLPASLQRRSLAPAASQWLAQRSYAELSLLHTCNNLSSAPADAAELFWQELRDELDLRGLDPSGLKAALVERLEAALASDGGALTVAANGAATNGAPEQPAGAAEAPAAATKGRQVRRELQPRDYLQAPAWLAQATAAMFLAVCHAISLYRFLV